MSNISVYQLQLNKAVVILKTNRIQRKNKKSRIIMRNIKKLFLVNDKINCKEKITEN